MSLFIFWLNKIANILIQNLNLDWDKYINQGMPKKNWFITNIVIKFSKYLKTLDFISWLDEPEKNVIIFCFIICIICCWILSQEVNPEKGEISVIGVFLWKLKKYIILAIIIYNLLIIFHFFICIYYFSFADFTLTFDLFVYFKITLMILKWIWTKSAYIWLIFNGIIWFYIIFCLANNFVMIFFIIIFIAAILKEIFKKL